MSKKQKSIVLEIDRDVLWYLFNEAHRRDITLNALVNEMLINYIKKLEHPKKKRKNGRATQ